MTKQAEETLPLGITKLDAIWADLSVSDPEGGGRLSGMAVWRSDENRFTFRLPCGEEFDAEASTLLTMLNELMNYEPCAVPESATRNDYTTY